MEIQANFDKKLQEILEQKDYLIKEITESKDAKIDSIITEKEKKVTEIMQYYNEKISLLVKENENKLQNALKEQEIKLDSINNQKQSELKELLHTERERQIALLTQKFTELSSKILDEKSKKFNENQEYSLKPLKEEISLFKQEIEKNTKDSIDKHARLEENIKKLLSESEKVSKEANNLTNALKGDNKMQGGWGEILLERLLELSGLKKGIEYETQVTIKNENTNLRPDVIITLPSERKVVVDSKVSLSAYERYVNGGNKTDLHAHIESVKKHIKGLQGKEYQKVVGENAGNKLDFVIMFMPIEGAFSAIVGDGLFEEGFKKGVILATPSTLLVILRLIENIWTNEAKDKNILKILGECEKLIGSYEKFKGNMKKIDKALDNAKDEFSKAQKELFGGNKSMGNILGNIQNYMSKSSNDAIDVTNIADVKTSLLIKSNVDN
ncbi:DNA recombination protein RmuC [Helicobacter saguini]|uniref:DNA recombination protein RmuC n=1 Tax=Helicobacter saguini TaxID=1548018 RepID=A0A4V6I2C9_9HELI|nr:DNA recombination protein RmuC [Helicobacter saguini]MWV61893.1 DNA recombination protein RmuC [Helicobacter saguini]MWV67432.1 DNA recombination protein RmuC [Helicobacter saguini]MWV69785.1 DNA recombination protein RmuC [Helicobacter saguini]MWV72998.1 DNA recombination protein RmuC [Helicobacter saguini]TLD95622.1 DNA recombination protein RmuC [Helicobacter saguini]